MKKGMIITNLPEHCRDCDFYGIKCRITNEMCKYYSENGRPESCPIQEVPDHEDLEEQNRLIKLPCAVGDMVYRIEEHSKSDNPENDDECEKITSLQVLYITFFGDEIQLTCREKKKRGETHCYRPGFSIGRKVFYTREEAEAALKGLERGKGNETD